MSSEPEDDLAAAQPSVKVKVAAALVGGAGVLTLVVGAQLVLFMRFVEPLLDIVGYVWTVLALALICLAAMMLRARAWATLGGAALSAVVAVAACAWAIYGIFGAFISCANVIVVPAAIAASVVSALALSDARRATTARARLADAGMDLGL